MNFYIFNSSMTYKEYIKKFILLFIFINIFTMIVFYTLNPYGIYQINIIPSTIMNSKRIKEKIVEFDDITQYNGLILGTSSVLGFDLDYMYKKTDIHYFNYALYNSTPLSALVALKHFYSKNKNIKKVLIGVDFFAYEDRDTVQEPICDTMYLKKYSGKQCNYWLIQFLKLHYQPQTFEVIYKNILHYVKQVKPAVVIHKDGRREYIKINELIKKNKYNFAKIMQDTSNTNSKYYLTYNSYKKNFYYLNKIIEFLQEHNIKYKIILPPIYPKYNTNLQHIPLYNDFYQELFKKYKNDIVDLRFLKENKNVYNFVDARHPSREYYNKIIDKYYKEFK